MVDTRSQAILRMKQPNGAVTHAEFSPSDGIIASAGDDKCVRVSSNLSLTLIRHQWACNCGIPSISCLHCTTSSCGKAILGHSCKFLRVTQTRSTIVPSVQTGSCWRRHLQIVRFDSGSSVSAFAAQQVLLYLETLLLLQCSGFLQNHKGVLTEPQGQWYRPVPSHKVLSML